uniref:Cystatin domain-containing protein n=1 Tax=Strongyloides stercoralis TaxID=6248 RepID=A0A0K0EEX7_STRER
MIHFKLFILAIATVFFINEVQSKPLKIKIIGWKDKDPNNFKIEKYGYQAVYLYNTEHHTSFLLDKVLEAKSKNNGTKYYDLVVLAHERCKGNNFCFARLHTVVIVNLSKKNNPKYEVDKLAE